MLLHGDFTALGKELYHMKKELRQERQRKERSENQKIIELLDKQEMEEYKIKTK